MSDLFLDFLIIMLVVVDPVGLTPIFAALTQGESASARRKMAVRGTLIAAVILVVFVLAGGMFRAVPWLAQSVSQRPAK